MRIGWIGLGAIGANMVLRALGAGLDMTVFARGAGLDAVRAAGAASVADHGALATASDILALCLFDDAQVRSVLFDDGALAAMVPGSILAIHTTGSPDLAREIGARAPAGVMVIDATFSGGPHTVLAGDLTAMVGGEADAVERARPLIASYASRIHHVGPLGHGQTIKLLNNLLFATNLKNAAALLEVAEGQGFAIADIVPILTGCSGDSYALNLFRSGVPVDAALARSWPFVSKDVATVAASAAGAGIDLAAFAPTLAFFGKDGPA
ncbi:NAD(P)-dependent oxidoreductase [Sphingobium sufflavum]|uniref:NAD(P)-dependent oxidoreductase n=1 Tax=Sphingobium sufflavum TaxID=1129547 RepID=UPI001F4653EE|nr:NAD(P)-dependent oxidoreductase [Sphingobium sufflavum]MCE7797371.1 NAD(P)-dependent oxidoreductase [Sphingobium sufflavum]